MINRRGRVGEVNSSNFSRALEACSLGLFGMLVACSVSQPVSAQASAQIQSFIKQKNTGCEVIGYHEIYRGTLQGSGQRMTVAAFAVEGCGGGNNSASAFGIYSGDGNTIHEWKQTPEPQGQVGAVAVDAGRVSVQWMSWKPSDPRCCPSIAHRSVYALRDGLAVAAR